MGTCRLSLAVVAILTLPIVFKPAPASAVAALAVATMPAAAPLRPLAAAHFRKTQSFYCSPRNYWWFYRPYTTGQDGHPRCMPYFHYLEPTYDGGRGRPNRYVK